MSRPTVRRVAVFTPLPPTQSGVAASNACLLPALSHHVEITAFVKDSDFHAVRPVGGVNVRPVGTFDDRDFDLAVQHIGNHGPFHEHAYESMLATPGLVVLHDLRLAEFFEWLERHRPDLVDLDHEPSAASAIADRGAGRAIQRSVEALRPVVERARGVLVHGGSALRLLSRVHPAATLFQSRLALPTPPRSQERYSSEMFGWPPTDLVAAAVGGITAHKRIEEVLEIVAALKFTGDDIRLVVAGWVFDHDYLARLQSIVASEGLAGHVRFLTDLSETELGAVYSMADVTVDLREDLTGAASMSLMTSLAHRRPSIVPDLDEFSDLTDPLILRVSNGRPQSAADCAKLLAEMSARKASGRAMPVSAPPDPTTTLAAVVEDHLRAIEACIELPGRPVPRVSLEHGRAVAARLAPVTILGDLTATTGLMEYGRSLANVLHSAGHDLRHWHVDCVGVVHDVRRDPSSLHRVLPHVRDARTELWLSNINEFVHIPHDLLRPAGTSRRIIASWFWELPVVQSPFLEQFSRVDEIWVGSPFVQRTFQQYTDAPVIVVPMPITTSPLPDVSRTDFGLGNDEVVFYFDFDANSHPARKNPFGVIEAYIAAFSRHDRSPDGRRPQLVIKATNLDREIHHGLRNRIHRAMDEVGGVLIDGELERRTLDSLMACCDVYVSMHRAEGLGIGMLEAMHLGKPVISPAYPHKWLFPAMAVGSAVGAQPRPIDDGDIEQCPEAEFVYSRGLMWTEPDVDDAAALMKRCFENPGLRRRIGNRAARLVREHYSVATALEVMASRLGQTDSIG